MMVVLISSVEVEGGSLEVSTGAVTCQFPGSILGQSHSSGTHFVVSSEEWSGKSL